MDQLEKHFDTAFAAPDGIKKLRELILTLAMQGKLVKQDPQDQAASKLLTEIEAEKRRLVKAGKIKAPKSLPEIKAEEVPYALPEGWEWVRLGEIGFWKSGTTPSRTNNAYYGGAIPWVKSGEVKQGHISSTDETITEKALSECSLNINPVGAVLIAMYGANIGEVGVLEIEATTNQAVCACTPYSLIDKTFLLNLLMSIKPNFIGQGAGAAQPNISREKIINTIIPLPPLAEQHRIVAKIDQLMTRCDELEKLRAEHEQKRLAVHNAALNRLLAAQERDSFAEAWQFITRHFNQLYSVKENVAELRKTILQLAVMGKLVPQNPNDPPASELLMEIEAEKYRLVKERMIKKAKPLPEIKPEEVPYVLPEGWKWVRFNDVLDVRDGTHDTPKYVEIGYPLITSKNLYTGKLSFEDVKFISEEDHKKICERSAVDVGDILFAMIGSIGNPVIVDCEDEFSIKNMALFKFYIAGKPDKQYLHYFLRLAQENMKATSSGAVQSFVSLGFLRSYLYPLPPLSEQQRIVAKIDQLMALCYHLEQQIDAATTKQSVLLNAVMAQV
jgi:type I restriction enzyme S subunit